MADSGVSRPRYQGLAAARRWNHAPVRPKAGFSLAVGDRLGDLTVIGHLARGRATELYQVWSNEHWCALTGKIVSPDALCSGGRLPASFRREAGALKQLSHPDIVRFYGNGVSDGRPWLLLEYLSGPSLFEVLESLPRRRLHVPDAIRAIMHIGAAVHYLHRRGCLYRDLKPGNVLLRAGIPILIDFDAVRPINSRRPADRLGTAPYMAPEQVLREPLTPATDVYGLGAVLYELLTGHWPTEAPSADNEWNDWPDEEESGNPSSDYGAGTLSGAELELRYPQLTSAPVPPREHRVRLDPRLEKILLRCLDPDPADRFQTVSGMLAALAPLLKGQYRLWPENVPIERRTDTTRR
ncbi:MAG: serine/threonine protein kinase [Gemmatimonadota bacterium]|jgi:serine/threonine protein kinase|nr:serine/threonine protein kinase [Gemmatimonadota bacterium]